MAMKNEKVVGAVLGLMSLVPLLIYTFVHTGGLLSRYVEPFVVGYVCAFGIELTVVSLSLRIGREGEDQKRAFFYFVLIAVVFVSAIANASEGFTTFYQKGLTSVTIREIDWLQAVIGGVSTALISLIVFALSEIIGTDLFTFLQDGETDLKVVSQDTQRFETKEERIGGMLEMIAQDPLIPVGDISKYLGVSSNTIYNYLRELESVGKIESRNGQGIIILESKNA